MALQKCAVNTNSEFKEMQPHGTSAFPCAGYENVITGRIEDDVAWHCHDEIEVIVILNGTLELQIPSERIVLSEGEMAVLNGNTLHSVVGKPKGVLQSMVFSPLLIAGNAESVFYKKYVLPLISCDHFVCTLFGREETALVERFRSAFADLKNDAFGYEFKAREVLSEILLRVYEREGAYLNGEQKTTNADMLRLTTMLHYIQQHYLEETMLADIANAANISTREALRCFKRTIGESPVQYLLKFRLMQSAEMLVQQPQESISAVSAANGFDSPAYYTKKFRELYLCTPREYRKNKAVE